MSTSFDPKLYSCDGFRAEAAPLLAFLREYASVRSARTALYRRVSDRQLDANLEAGLPDPRDALIVRDCARAWRGILRKRTDGRIGFSVIAALWDIAHDRSRPELEPGFFAEMLHLFRGIEGRATRGAHYATAEGISGLQGREAAVQRSDELDRMWGRVSATSQRYADGLSATAIARRVARRERIQRHFGASSSDWLDWHWQARHIIRSEDALSALAAVSEAEREGVRAAVAARLPFGITPYYLSLFDDDPQAGRDTAVRAQVLPPMSYVREMAARHGTREQAFDFMLEHDTSPIDLVTRRYPAIAILKPFNTCPQICVYCQRNWEIDEAMSPDALAAPEKIEAACQWLADHPAITEVLVTGGDPLALTDIPLGRLLQRLARIESVDLIRIGTRVPVTMPMRITDELVSLLASVRVPGRREVCLVTHVEHPYELTPEFLAAVERVRRQGISVYNQLVYTFYVSRRFEAARLRMLLRRCGVDPYYTFVPKGKEETLDYRVPLARLMQEQQEESRLFPGLRRTDEVVYNLPGLGKNHLRAIQQRDVVSVLPDGARVYEFHAWDKQIVRRESYLGTDIPIYDYLCRLAAMGENPDDYSSIWYYF